METKESHLSAPVAVSGSSGLVGTALCSALNACWPLREKGIRVIHVRLGIVLSRSGGALRKMLPVFKYFLGGKLGSGQQYWSWIALDDCVRALTMLIKDHDCQGPYNLVSPISPTNAEFTQTLAGVLGRPAVLAVPAAALRLIVGEMADAVLLSSCRVVPQRLHKAGFEFQYPELEMYLRHELRFSSPRSPITTSP